MKPPAVFRPESKTVRAFVAGPSPETARTRLEEVQDELKQILPRNSTAWIRPANMHLTFRFLGNVATHRIVKLSEKLRATLAGFGELDFVCERLGCFPDLPYPRVVWAWMHDKIERLEELRRRVELTVAEFAAQPAETRFVGHITLARPKQIKRPDAERLASDLVLMRSELSSGGAKYEELFRAPLR